MPGRVISSWGGRKPNLMPKVTGNDILKIALANPDVTVPPEALDALKPTKRNKYNAQRVEAFDGMKFDSKAEMRRYGELRWLEMNGDISDLKHHPIFPLHAGVKYIADFQYVEKGRVIVEDVKGGRATQTAAFKIKWKQAIELYPDIKFRIVGG